jgi:hypothetical protein
MKFLRPVAACGIAAIAAGSVTLAAAPVAATAAATTAYHRPSASYLVQARSALVRFLGHSHPGAMFVHQARPHTSHAPTAESTYNWSGYADESSTDGTFTKVSGSWTVPTVTCTAEDTINSVWVGLDGATSSTVEQDGTLQWCFEDKATYYTWYEMYPAGTVSVGTTVKPGDKISASVSRSSTSYTLKVTDSTTSGNNVSETATCAATTCLDTSAEWISERSAFSIGIAPLADYKTWSLSSASETASGKTGSISGYATSDEITMVDATDSYDLATVSALNSKGNGFSTTWKNSY